MQVSWNSQNYPDSSSITPSQQSFWYHSPIQLTALLPCGLGKTDMKQYVTVIGSNFINSSSLVVQFGDSKYLCYSSNCPFSGGIPNSISFLSPELLAILVDPQAEDSGNRKVLVSNFNQVNTFIRSY